MSSLSLKKETAAAAEESSTRPATTRKTVQWAAYNRQYPAHAASRYDRRSKEKRYSEKEMFVIRRELDLLHNELFPDDQVDLAEEIEESGMGIKGMLGKAWKWVPGINLNPHRRFSALHKRRLRASIDAGDTRNRPVLDNNIDAEQSDKVAHARHYSMEEQRDLEQEREALEKLSPEELSALNLSAAEVPLNDNDTNAQQPHLTISRASTEDTLLGDSIGGDNKKKKKPVALVIDSEAANGSTADSGGGSPRNPEHGESGRGRAHDNHSPRGHSRSPRPSPSRNAGGSLSNLKGPKSPRSSTQNTHNADKHGLGFGKEPTVRTQSSPSLRLDTKRPAGTLSPESPGRSNSPRNSHSGMHFLRGLSKSGLEKDKSKDKDKDKDDKETDQSDNPVKSPRSKKRGFFRSGSKEAVTRAVSDMSSYTS